MSKRTGRSWSSGGFSPFREDLVAWPSVPPSEPSAAAEETAVAKLSPEEARVELVRSLVELRELRARVAALTAENDRLRALSPDPLAVEPPEP